MNLATIISEIPNYALVAVVFLTIVTLLVAAHEYGHYIFARMFKMGVEEFAIGFGKKPLFKFMERTYESPEGPETTVFNVRPWPLGGFVRIKGMEPKEDGSEVDVKGGFYNKPPWQRFLVLLAGPLFSIVAGLIILVPIFMIVGVPSPGKEPVIGALQTGGAAEKAGLKEGDRITAIDGASVSTFYDMVVKIRDNGGAPIVFSIERGAAPQTVIVTPVVKEAPVLGPDLEMTDARRKQSTVGFGPVSIREKMAFLPALGKAAQAPVEMVKNLAAIVTRQKNAADEVGGPLSIISATSQTVKSGLSDVIAFAGLLSISLGIFNLLPIPFLDGGQMVVAIVEQLRRGRRLSFKLQEKIAGVGFVLILALIGSVFVLDIKRFLFKAEEKPAVSQQR